MRLASLLLVGLLAACGTTQSPMAYAPTVPVSAAASRPLVTVVEPVANQRRAGGNDPRWIGTIRSGYGNPVKTLEADRPVDQVVASAFADALASRGLQAATGAGRYALAITIYQFDANQYVRREATADFGIRVTERATGREVWSDRTKAYNVDGSILSLSTGVFASVDDLKRVALRSMSEAVDTLLDKPGFRAALRG